MDLAPVEALTRQYARSSRRAPRALVIGPPPPGGDIDRLDDELRVVGRLPTSLADESLTAALRQHQPHLVLCTGSLEQIDDALLAACRLHGATVYVLARPSYGAIMPMRIRRFGGLPWVRVGRRSSRLGDERLKRAFDLSLTLLTLPLTLPLILLLTIATTASGSPFYVQTRVGAGGREFKMLKFRTMVMHAERDVGPTLAVVGDHRVTRIGRVLRRLRLDELPQLWNVLRGDMSLVGPRPERPEFVAELRRLPHYHLREMMRPGLAGIAQLTCGYHATAADKLRCDLLYFHSRSLRSDVKLLALAALELCRGFPRG